jgi:hypothetical protein
MGGSWFKASPGKNVSKTIFQNISWAWLHMRLIPAKQEADAAGLKSKAGLGKRTRP